jgi:hypothetical protein
MNGFEPHTDPATYFAALKQRGYETKRHGGSPQGESFQGIRVFQVTIVRGHGLAPCVLASWRHTNDPEMTYLSSRQFDDETELSEWLQRYGITLSRHARPL